MRKTRKVIVLIAITALVLALPLSAQIIGTPGSNTSQATSGIFGNDVDDYMSYHFYSDVKFEKWFGFVGWNSNPSLGYATKLGGIYLGAWYNGNIVSIPSGTYTETITPDYDDDNQILISSTKTISYSSVAMINTNNHLEILLGLGGMGFKVGVFENLQTNKLGGNSIRTFTTTDTQDGLIEYRNEPVEFNSTSGSFRPYVGWGASFGSLRPYAELSFDMYQYKQIDTYKDYDTYLGKQTGTENIRRAAGSATLPNGDSYMMPALGLGLEYDLAKKTNTQTTLGLGYNMDIKLYNNDYGASGVNGTAKGTVYWGALPTTITHYADRTVTSIANQTIDIVEIKDMNHGLVPSFMITGEPISGFKLGFRAELPVSLGIKSEDYYQDKYSITTVKYDLPNVDKSKNYTNTVRVHEANGLLETTVLDIGANLSLGASFALVPNRFTVNAGIGGTPFTFTRTVAKASPNGPEGTTTYTTEVDGYGAKTIDTVVYTPTGTYQSDTTATNAIWTAFSYGFSGGFVFNFSPQAAVDMVVSASNRTSGATALNLSSVRLLFTFNF